MRQKSGTGKAPAEQVIKDIRRATRGQNKSCSESCAKVERKVNTRLFAVDTPFASCTVRPLWTEVCHDSSGVEWKVARRTLLKEHERKILFDIPVDEDNLIRHYSLSPADLLEIQLRRREHNQLPSLAFGMKSCSIKWKQKPQDQVIKGAKSGPNASAPHPIWLNAQARGERIVKLIGYDCGRADMRRSARLPAADADFDYAYPLQILGWGRAECIHVISAVLGPETVPIKSACFFCPASKIWELYWLAAHHPELLERALLLERNALTGRHSRFNEVEFGASWEDLVRTADRFPGTSTTVGLGRSFSWNQWARVNGVVDENFRVRRGAGHRARFLELSDRHRGDDNAMDIRRRSCGVRRKEEDEKEREIRMPHDRRSRQG